MLCKYIPYSNIDSIRYLIVVTVCKLMSVLKLARERKASDCAHLAIILRSSRAHCTGMTPETWLGGGAKS